MTIVRILIVTDDDGGFQRSNTAAHKFHVGEFVRVLSDTTWEGFDIEITRAHRSADPSPSTPQPSHPIGADLYGFRFTAESLEGFHVVFFFSIANKAEDPVSSDTDRRAEAAAVAAFMESGGGVFATGDHEDLGASICQHIPRVRSMRRWGWPGLGPHGGAVAPSGTAEDRHDTLRAGSDTGTSGSSSYAYQFNDQSDDVPQSIDVMSYSTYRNRLFQVSMPHPLLCSPLGRINVLPDHMHEGWCEVPPDLTRNEDLPGRAGKKEYPADDNGEVVKPEVIAEATVLAHETLNQEFAGSDYEISPMTSTHDPFGVIAAYDGYLAGIGRVVVDATWHHFVNINLIGTAASFTGLNPKKTKGFYTGPGDTPVAAYEKIMWYYRNLVYWLIPASLSQSVFLKQLVQALHFHPRSEELKGVTLRTDLSREQQLQRVVRFATLTQSFFDNVHGHCANYHMLPLILYPKWKFDPTIWEELGPEIAPWDPLTRALSSKIKPLAAWRQAFLPDARLRWYVLLGSMAMAVSEKVGLHDEISERHVAVVQERMRELLPKHLEILAEEIESGMELTRERSARLRELAATMSRS